MLKGDVHPDGNPHFVLDPHNIAVIAKLITKKLVLLDYANKTAYENNLQNFLQDWEIYLKGFDTKMAVCKDKKVVQYHQLFNYFLQRYNYTLVGNIEPLPGISPSSKDALKTINLMKEKGVNTILQDVYHEKKNCCIYSGQNRCKSCGFTA